MHVRASAGLCGALALVLLGACTRGPPFGDDLPALHHDPFPAATEREARFVRTRHFGSAQKCEEHLNEVASRGVVRISSYEAVAHRDISHEGRQIIEEHHCSESTLRIRAWYASEDEGEAAHH